MHVFFESDRTTAGLARWWIWQPRRDLEVIVTVAVGRSEQNVVVVIVVEERLRCLVWPARLFCRSWYHTMNLSSSVLLTSQFDSGPGWVRIQIGVTKMKWMSRASPILIQTYHQRRRRRRLHIQMRFA